MNPYDFMIVDAEILDGNIIRVDSKNVSELSLTPDKQLVDYAKPVRVVWNGKASLVNMHPSMKIVLNDNGYSPLAGYKTPHLAGPIADFQNTPFLLVVGTISKDSMMSNVIRQKARTMVNNWWQFQKYEPRVKNDVDVTEADMKMYSLFLLGGPEDNKVSKLIFEKIPIQINSGVITMDGKSFKANDAVLSTIYPNPFNKERYLRHRRGNIRRRPFLFRSKPRKSLSI